MKVKCPDCGTMCKVQREYHADSIDCHVCGLLCEIDYESEKKEQEDAEDV